MDQGGKLLEPVLPGEGEGAESRDIDAGLEAVTARRAVMPDGVPCRKAWAPSGDVLGPVGGGITLRPASERQEKTGAACRGASGLGSKSGCGCGSGPDDIDVLKPILEPPEHPIEVPEGLIPSPHDSDRYFEVAPPPEPRLPDTPPEALHGPDDDIFGEVAPPPEPRLPDPLPAVLAEPDDDRFSETAAPPEAAVPMDSAESQPGQTASADAEPGAPAVAEPRGYRGPAFDVAPGRRQSETAGAVSATSDGMVGRAATPTSPPVSTAVEAGEAASAATYRGPHGEVAAGLRTPHDEVVPTGTAANASDIPVLAPVNGGGSTGPVYRPAFAGDFKAPVKPETLGPLPAAPGLGPVAPDLGGPSSRFVGPSLAEQRIAARQNDLRESQSPTLSGPTGMGIEPRAPSGGDQLQSYADFMQNRPQPGLLGQAAVTNADLRNRLFGGPSAEPTPHWSEIPGPSVIGTMQSAISFKGPADQKLKLPFAYLNSERGIRDWLLAQGYRPNTPGWEHGLRRVRDYQAGGGFAKHADSVTRHSLVLRFRDIGSAADPAAKSSKSGSGAQGILGGGSLGRAVTISSTVRERLYGAGLPRSGFLGQDVSTTSSPGSDKKTKRKKRLCGPDITKSLMHDLEYGVDAVRNPDDWWSFGFEMWKFLVNLRSPFSPSHVTKFGPTFLSFWGAFGKSVVANQLMPINDIQTAMKDKPKEWEEAVTRFAECPRRYPCWHSAQLFDYCLDFEFISNLAYSYLSASVMAQLAMWGKLPRTEALEVNLLADGEGARPLSVPTLMDLWMALGDMEPGWGEGVEDRLAYAVALGVKPEHYDISSNQFTQLGKQHYGKPQKDHSLGDAFIKKPLPWGESDRSTDSSEPYGGLNRKLTTTIEAWREAEPELVRRHIDVSEQCDSCPEALSLKEYAELARLAKAIKPPRKPYRSLDGNVKDVLPGTHVPPVGLGGIGPGSKG